MNPFQTIVSVHLGRRGKARLHRGDNRLGKDVAGHRKDLQDPAGGNASLGQQNRAAPSDGPRRGDSHR